MSIHTSQESGSVTNHNNNKRLHYRMSFKLSSSSEDECDDDNASTSERQEFRSIFLSNGNCRMNNSSSLLSEEGTVMENTASNDDTEYSDDNDVDWEDASSHDEREVLVNSQSDSKVTGDLLPKTATLKEVELSLDDDRSTLNDKYTPVTRKRKRTTNVLKYISPQTSSLIMNIHRSHMLSLTANCIHYSGLAMEDSLKHVCLSIIPEEFLNFKYQSKQFCLYPSIEEVKKVFDWFVELVHNMERRRSQLAYDSVSGRALKQLEQSIISGKQSVKKCEASCKSLEAFSDSFGYSKTYQMLRFIEYISPHNDYNHNLPPVKICSAALNTIFCCICRLIGWRTRFVKSLRPTKKTLTIDHPLFSDDLRILLNGVIKIDIRAEENPNLMTLASQDQKEMRLDETLRSMRVVENYDMVWVEILTVNSKHKSVPPSWVHVDISCNVFDNPTIVELLQAMTRGDIVDLKLLKSQLNKRYHKKETVSYVVAVEHQDLGADDVSMFNSYTSKVTDVTPRYASRWTETLLLRGMPKSELKKSGGQCKDMWWSRTLKKLNRHLHEKKAAFNQNDLLQNGKNTKVEIIDVDHSVEQSEYEIDNHEIKEFKKLNINEPFPSAKASFKNHPLYAIKSLLNKYEVLHPDSNRYICGMFKGEIVYRRSDVYNALPARKWLYNRRKVLESQINKPVKILVAKQNINSSSNEKHKFKPLKSYGIGLTLDRSLKQIGREKEKVLSLQNDRVNDDEYLFAVWQTAEWSPSPVSLTDPIPVNEHNNVELELLNPGLIHIDERNIANIAKRLGIPYAPCLVGFENSRQGRVPVIRGIVVHAQNEEILQEAKFEIQSLDLQQQQQKRTKAVYNRWKRLILGLLTKDRLEREYPDEIS